MLDQNILKLKKYWFPAKNDDVKLKMDRNLGLI